MVPNSMEPNHNDHASKAADASAARPRAQSKSIEDVVENIVHHRLGLPTIDCSPYIDILKQNLVYTEQLLYRVPLSALSRMKLPILLEVELANMIHRATEALHDRSSATGGSSEDYSFSRAPHSSHPESQLNNTNAFSGSLLNPHIDDKAISLELLTRSEDTNEFPTPRSLRSSRSVKALDAADFSLYARRRNSSNILDLISKHHRVEILDQCEFVLDLQRSEKTENQDQFATVFYETLTELAPELTTLLGVEQRLQRTKTMLFGAISVIAQVLSGPLSDSQLVEIATKHHIWGVEKRHFKKFATALCYALEVTLGSDIITPVLKEIWTLIVHYLADRIISQYDRIAVGYSGSLITKTGKEWKKFPAVLAHDALILFIDAQKLQVKEEIDLGALEYVGPNDTSKLAKVTPYSFCCVVDGLRRVFFVDSAEELQWWLSELQLRVSAFALLRGETTPPVSLRASGSHSNGSPPDRNMKIQASQSSTSSSPIAIPGKSQSAPLFGGSPTHKKGSLSPRDRNASVNSGKKSSESHESSRSATLSRSQQSGPQWEDVRKDPSLFNEFKKFLQTRLNEEHLLFWKEALNYQETFQQHPHSESMRQRADKIYRKYITGELYEGKYMISISSTIGQQLKRAMEAGQASPDIFTQAIMDIEHSVLRQSFLEFQKNR